MSDHYCIYCMEKTNSEAERCAHCNRPRNYEAPVHHIKPGTILKGKYLIGRALGEGGFGITYIGRDLTLDMRVAVKEFFPNGYSHRNHDYTNEVTITQNTEGHNFEKEIQQFLHEARILARFSDEPGIVGVRDFFRENGTAYIVMDYLDGITLKSYIRRSGPIPADKLFAMMDPVLTALSRIHGEGLIHRDISPDNIFVLKNEKLKLLDFGAARNFTDDKSLSVVLKPGYAPEEQYRTRGNQGPWTDVYALCATMYKCLTGVTPDDSLERVYKDTLKPPSELGISISSEQEAALMGGLRVRVGDRIQSMEALQKALQAKVLLVPSASQPKADEAQAEPIAETEDEKTVYALASDDEQTIFQLPETRPKDKKSVNKEANGVSKHAKGTGPKRPKAKKLCLIACIVAAILLLGIGVSRFSFGGAEVKITTVPGHDSYSLEKVGQIDDADRAIEFHQQVISRKERANPQAFHLLNYLGEEMTNCQYSSAWYLGYDLYAVKKDSEDINSVGLMTSTGEMLIPEEACLIKWPYSQEERNCRYLVVYYATEQVTEEEDFLVCATETGTYSSKFDGGKLYAGYVRIYDREKNQFVGDHKFNSDSLKVEICGSNLVIKDTETGTALYNADGTRLMELEASVDIGDGTFVRHVDSTYRVYDENGQQTYSANNGLSIIGHSAYIKTKSGEQYIALDRNGNPVLQGAYDNITEVYNGLFLVEQNEMRGLVSADGKEVAPIRYEYIYSVNLEDEISSFYYGRNGKRYTLFCPQGAIMTDLGSSQPNMVHKKGGSALVLNNRSYALELGNARCNDLTTALISVSAPDTGLYGVYDLFTGQQLLPPEYEVIQYAAGYLYAYKNEGWEIYNVVFQEGT